MSKERRGFVPLSEIESERIDFNVNLPPYIDESQIGIHLNRVRQLMRIGGISHLSIVGENGQISRTEAEITGHTTTGEAVASGKILIEEVPFYSTEDRSTSPQPLQGYAARWKKLVIEFNTAEVANRIRTDQKYPKGSRDATAWSDYLNGALQKGIMHGGTSHLIFGLTRSEQVFYTAWNVYAILLLGGVKDFSVIPMIEWYAGTAIAGQTIQRGLYHFTYDENGHRFSTFWGPQFDRALILDLVSKTRKLAKPFERKERS